MMAALVLENDLPRSADVPEQRAAVCWLVARNMLWDHGEGAIRLFLRSPHDNAHVRSVRGE